MGKDRKMENWERLNERLGFEREMGAIRRIKILLERAKALRYKETTKRLEEIQDSLTELCKNEHNNKSGDLCHPSEPEMELVLKTMGKELDEMAELMEKEREEREKRSLAFYEWKRSSSTWKAFSKEDRENMKFGLPTDASQRDRIIAMTESNNEEERKSGIELLKGLNAITVSSVSESRMVKYSCPFCSIDVWGKPHINITCGNCNKLMEPWLS